MNQREKDQKNKAKKSEARKRVLARREEIRKTRKEEIRLEKEFEDRESKYLSRDEITQRLEHNLKILEQMEKLLAEQEKAVDLAPPSDDNSGTPVV